jgi:hypothetical protein
LDGRKRDHNPSLAKFAIWQKAEVFLPKVLLEAIFTRWLALGDLGHLWKRIANSKSNAWHRFLQLKHWNRHDLETISSWPEHAFVGRLFLASNRYR